MFFLIPILTLLAVADAWRADINLLTHNIRYNATDLLPGELPWSQRAPGLIAELRKRAAEWPDTFLSLQEALDNQVQDIYCGLNAQSDPWSTTGENQSQADADWEYIGVGRDDGKQAGEYSPIFYRPSRFQLNNWTTYWLSPTPNVPSKGWDAGSIRIVTVGHFTHRFSGINLVALNTHLDNAGEISRRNSALFIRKLVKQFNEDGLPVWLTGDFNSPPDDEAYQLITENNDNTTLVDTKTIAKKVYGFNETYTGFDEPGVEAYEIDFIFVSPRLESPWSVKRYEVLSSEGPNGYLISDHRAVTVDLVLEARKEN